MGLNANSSLWMTDGPAAWPDAPVEMTVTTLREIESCPRRWALSAGHYPDLWSGRGYPPCVRLGALAGSVVHLALEVITGALARAGCPSLEDPAALQVMRDLGGYTKVVDDCIDRTLSRLANSPRAQRVIEVAARSLRAKVPELRTRTQTMLCRVRLPPIQGRQAEGSARRARGPLTAGTFAEMELRAEEIGWKGKVDLLVLSPDVCEIIDFKTGLPDEGHRFQVHVYALLWSRDGQLNPGRRRADRLVLAYGRGDEEVPSPTELELDGLEYRLIARAAAAREAVSQRPPEAKPSPENCLYCNVRHLCNEYWAGPTLRQLGDGLGGSGVTDIAIRITGRHGPLSWDAVVESSAAATHGDQFLLRADKRPLSLRPGQVVRLLAVHISDPGGEDPESVMVGTLGTTSEVFLV